MAILGKHRSRRGVWRRLRAVGYLAGVRSRPGETPIEFGARLTRQFPELQQAIETLIGQYSRAAYANVRKEPVLPAALAALGRLELHLVRSVFSRVATATASARRRGPRRESAS